ncbi:MAG: MFS transporter [Bacteroidota bacterium]
MKFEKGNKKIINAWCWFDWANSVYPLVITTAVFPIYFSAVTTTEIPGQAPSNIVSVFGIDFTNSALYSYSLAFSFLLISMISPLLSGIADYSGKKKRFMQFFSTLGAISSAGLFFFTGMDTLWVGLMFSVLASIGFAGSLVFYNAFLPEIAHEKDMDMVSAKGFTMGYIGSSILLIMCLALIMFPTTFGIPDEGMATRISFLMAGLWWFGFATITFSRLPENVHDRKVERGEMLRKGYRELRSVWRQLQEAGQKRLRIFLMAFFFYAFGYTTVLYLATIFGENELNLAQEQLIATVLIIQFVAIGGSYFFAWFAAKAGNLRSLMLAVVIWAAVCASTWFVHDAMGFYVVAFFVGTVMGGIQALSRSTYAKMLPETEDHASYYSFYEFTEKVATALGTFSFGAIISLTGGMRNSTVFLASVFVVGLGFLIWANRIPAPPKSPETAAA